jgi:HlyD family secretion protein
MKGAKLYIFLGLIVAGLVALGIANRKGWIGGKKGIKIAVDTIKTKNIIEAVSASGKIYPVAEVKVSPDISGEIVNLYVSEGDVVTKGQLLAKVDQSLYTNTVSRANASVNQSKSAVAQLRAQLAQLQIQVNQAKLTYDRNLKLYNEKVISAAEFEVAQTALKAAQANVRAAEESLSGASYNVDGAVAGLNDASQSIRRTNIYAPASGIVTRLNVKQGERVVGTAQMAGTEMMRIADMSRMKVEVEIGENDIQKIRLGDTAIIEVDAYTRRKFRGLVSKIAESNTSSAAAAALNSDQVSNYTVSIEIDKETYLDLMDNNRRFPFRPGMSASVEILTEHHNNVLAAPIVSVTTRDLDSNDNEENIDDILKEYVFVIQKVKNKEQVKLIEVKTGVQDNNSIEILSGAKAGDVIVSAPYSAITLKLKDSDMVQIVPKKELFAKEEKD